MKDKLSRRVAIKTTAAASIGIGSGAFGFPKGLTKYLILEEPLEIDWIEITPAGGTSKQSERWDFGGNHSRK
jgi:hypothetical protein